MQLVNNYIFHFKWINTEIFNCDVLHFSELLQSLDMCENDPVAIARCFVDKVSGSHFLTQVYIVIGKK